MTVPQLTITTDNPLSIDSDVLVLGVLSTPDGAALAVDTAEYASIGAALEAVGATGSRDQLIRLPSIGGSARSVALVGLGVSEPNSQALRYAAGAAVRLLGGVETVTFHFPVASDEDLDAILEGAAIAAYSFTRYRAASLDKEKNPPSAITVVGESTNSDAIVARAQAIADAIHLVKDLVNTPPIDLFPQSFADAAIEAVASDGIDVTVLDEQGLSEGGYGGILGVGMGSARPPRMVRLEYSPAGATRHLALVGKGITFDSGGLSLKPAASMVGMKYDMTGAATVLAVVRAASRLRLPVKITGWLCLAENMPSSTALRPNDVITVRGGTTVEVLNTDAEGRLVLADGLVAASEEMPDAIIDVATLTGAAIVALGNRYVPMMGDENLLARISKVADQVDEKVWPMPMPDELRPALNSDVADLANARIGNSAGGMLLASVFLREFIGTADGAETRIPWAHLDIAGAANNSGGAYGFTGKGPTGVTVRTLVALAQEFGQA
ncbi:leucyl aminopeptidase [Homoserinimonas hongtaonis]|uniref:leucyl aminopeptidase n=1 Tax=Homoserinimonas hongtaonis TaxID=2079791 RepID=UPI000D35637B|nr:leucyl aminopeptidase [Salinibacterium hongtaonis]AWB90610.1 leucyl aminopeptidase [Salinibacterium hongtaonis]